MSMPEFDSYDALDLAELVRTRQVTPLELVDEVIERLEAVQNSVHPLAIEHFEMARSRAREPLPEGPLAGVPWLMKNLLLMAEGTVTSNSLTFLAQAVAPHDSEMVRRAKAGGMILVGKTNVPEFGYCISTEPAMYGPTRNPWNLERVAGGSSGGSAAAVAARVLPLAHASDGGGSIRIPASYNGLVGLKISRGRGTYAPDYTDIWAGSAVEGCVSRSVRDTAAYLDLVAGGVTGDPYEMPAFEPPLAQDMMIPPPKLRVGYTQKGMDGVAVDPAVAATLRDTLQMLTEMGHTVEEMTLACDYEVVTSQFAVQAAAEATAGFAMLEGLLGRGLTAEDFSPVNWQRVELGRGVSGVAVLGAIEALRLAGRAIAQSCAPYDVVVTPTMPRPAPELGYFDMYGMDLDAYHGRLLPEICFTLPFNVSGQPAVSLPLGQSPEGLPIGIQFAALRGQERLLLKLATQIEAAAPWKDRRAPHGL